MLGFILGFPFRGIFLHNLLQRCSVFVRLFAHKISSLLPRLPFIWRDNKAIPTNMNVSIFHQQPHQQCSVNPAGSNDKYICSTAPKWVLIDGSVGKCRRLCAAVVGDRWACHISLVTTLDHRCAPCLLPAYPTLAYPTPPLVKHKPTLFLQFLLLPRIPSIIFDIFTETASRPDTELDKTLCF